MIRVYICDDHKLVVEGISLMLSDEQAIEFAGFSPTGEDLVALAKTEPRFCDVLLLDINLPGINGIEVCKVMKQLQPAIKIIALSMLKELSLVKMMLKNGADGYLVKNAGKTEIVAAIRAIQEGKRFIDEELKDLLLSDFTTNVKQRRSTELVPSLSRREKEILQLILDEHTAAEIAEKLYISTGTVETHRRNMLSKLGARNTAGLVRMAMEYDLLHR